MFSSNQIFQISGDMDQMAAAIEFAVEYSGRKEIFKRKDDPARCAFQITEDGRYCIGWSYGKTGEGWTDYPFDYDAEIISGIVRQHIEKNEKPFNKFEGSDGASEIGFLLQGGTGSSSYEEEQRIKNGFFCIASIRPFWCFYAK